MEVKEQRIGQIMETVINYIYINSGEYNRKIDLISNNKKLSRILYRVAKEMLEHRSGKTYANIC